MKDSCTGSQSSSVTASQAIVALALLKKCESGISENIYFTFNL